MVKEERILKIIRLVVLAIGVGLLIGSYFAKTHHEKRIAEYRPVTVQIESIEERHVRRDGKNKVDHDVTVTYQIDGQNFREELNFYSSTMNVGDRLPFLYNPENPHETYYPELGKVLHIILFGVGILLVVMGGLVLPLVFRRIRQRQSQLQAE